MVAEIGTIEAGQHPLNSVCFDRSATRMAAASNDGTVKVRYAYALQYFSGSEGEKHAYFENDNGVVTRCEVLFGARADFFPCEGGWEVKTDRKYQL